MENLNEIIEKQILLLAERSQGEPENPVLCDLSRAMEALARFVSEN